MSGVVKKFGASQTVANSIATCFKAADLTNFDTAMKATITDMADLATHPTNIAKDWYAPYALLFMVSMINDKSLASCSIDKTSWNYAGL